MKPQRKELAAAEAIHKVTNGGHDQSIGQHIADYQPLHGLDIGVVILSEAGQSDIDGRRIDDCQKRPQHHCKDQQPLTISGEPLFVKHSRFPLARQPLCVGLRQISRLHF